MMILAVLLRPLPSVHLADSCTLCHRGKDEARCLFDEILQYSNHLGLFSEDIDFETKEQLGNFPQAYSHLALVNTAVLFAEEDKRLIFK